MLLFIVKVKLNENNQAQSVDVSNKMNVFPRFILPYLMHRKCSENLTRNLSMYIYMFKF